MWRGGAGKAAERACVAIAPIAAILSLLIAFAAPAAADSPVFQRAFGRDVIQPGKPGDTGIGAEICTLAADCKAGVSGGAGGEFNSPAGLATDAAGNVYLADSTNHRVQKFDAAGNFIRAWGRDVIASGGAGDTGTGFEVCTVAADCKAGTVGGLGGELNSPTGVATDGPSVYVADYTNNRIQRFDLDGGFQRTWGKNVSISSGDTEFEICTIQADCRAGTAGGLGGELDRPYGVATDGAGNVYAAESWVSPTIGGARVQKYNSSGVWERAWGKNVISGGPTGAEVCTSAPACKRGEAGAGLGGELFNPAYVAATGGSVYVTDPTNRRVEKFAPDGTWERAWGTDVISGAPTGAEVCTVAPSCKAGAIGTGLGGETEIPLGVAIDSAGNVQLVDQVGHRVQEFTPAGGFVRAFGRDVISGNLATGFEVCTLAAMCKSGDGSGGLGGTFSFPTGVAATAGSRHLYVSDTAYFRVQRLWFDNVPPNTNLTSTPGPSDAVLTDNSPSFGFASPDADTDHFRCELTGPGGPYIDDPCTSPHPYSSLPEGGWYHFEVAAVDGAGNVDPTPASYDFWIDTIDPETTLDLGPDDPTNDPTPTFTFSSNEGGTFQCRVDGGAFAACSSPHTTGQLSDGTHIFEVRAVDQGGNVDPTPASQTFTVDTQAPVVTIDSGPANGSAISNNSPSFSFSSAATDIDRFTCQLTGPGAPVSHDPCASPRSYSGLVDGNYTFSVTAIDQAGNASNAAARSFTIDTIAPQTQINSAPGGATADNTPTFTFSASESTASFQCRVDGGPFAACTTPHTTAPLADGAHIFEVRATDAAGNIDPTPAAHTFVVDTTGPAVTINSGPADGSVISNDSPSFTFSSSATDLNRFVCELTGPGGPVNHDPCTSPRAYAGLVDGNYTFSVRGVDGLGNTGSTVARSFTIDATAPDTQIDSGPSGTTADSTPTFTFSANESTASFECRVDDGPFAACTTPHTTAPLADGAHTFEVRAVDAVGNADPTPAARAFTVDTATPPPPSGPPPAPDPPPDTTAPRAEVSAKSKQKAKKPIKVEVGSDEAATADAVGKVNAKGAKRSSASAAGRKLKVKLGDQSAEVPAGGTVTLELSPKKKQLKKLAKLVKAGAKAKATITVTLTDAAGNESDAQQVKVKLR